MMSISSREVDSPTKAQEANTSDAKVTKKVASSSSTPRLGLKDPRIVRVSPAFGGKDRHSKVCTIRGLRDRRVRLSVPTAIQLYDLQDRLGLNQPSKVVDWLLNVAKSEIDELPPLPIPPGNFGLFDHHPMVSSSNEAGVLQFNKEGFKLDKGVDWEELPRPGLWNSEAPIRVKAKEIARASFDEKDKWMKRNDEEDKQEDNVGNPAHVSSSSFLSRLGHSSSSNLVNNAMPYGSFFHLEAPNLTVSHLGSHGFASQSDDPHGHSSLNEVSLPSNLSLSSGPQFLVYPTGTTQSYLPSHEATSMEIDPRQIYHNHFQMLAATTQNLSPNSLTPSPYSLGQYIGPFHFSVMPRLHGENKADKDQDFHAND